MSAYARVFRGTMVLFLVFLVIFVISLYLSLGYPSSVLLFRFRYEYYAAAVSGLFSVGGGVRLVQLRRKHERFKNTGYDYPYPDNV